MMRPFPLDSNLRRPLTNFAFSIERHNSPRKIGRVLVDGYCNARQTDNDTNHTDDE